MPSRNRKRPSEPPIVSPQLSLPFPGGDPGRREGPGRATCVHCGGSFTAPVWYVREGLRVVFCGEACRRAWQECQESELLTLDGRPDHRGGDWEARSRQARERDGFACQVCGITEEGLGRSLDVHHIVPFRLFPSDGEANRLPNLISVCPVCHARLESQGLDRTPLFGRNRSRKQVSVRVREPASREAPPPPET
jgi:hypothetical protein